MGAQLRKKDELLSLWRSANVINQSKNIALQPHTKVFHKSMRTFAAPWPKHWLQNKTGVAEYDCGRGPSQLIHKGFKWEFKKKKKSWCFVVGRMSCVGYQSRLFPVCVNRLPHRLCLGYTPPRGVAFKMTGLWWENCVFLCVRLSYQPTVRTDHRVGLQRNLLILNTWAQHSSRWPASCRFTVTGKEKWKWFCFVDGSRHWSCFQSVIRPRPGEEEQETWHSAHPIWLCITSCSCWPAGHMFFLLLPFNPIRPNSSVWMSFVARVLKETACLELLSIVCTVCTVYARLTGT